MKVRNKLGFFLQKHDISLLRLSKELEVNYTTLNSFYKGRHNMLNTELVSKLCIYFNCKIGELLYLEEEDY
jgi:DNA-binding Xre family transcriptional regulator